MIKGILYIGTDRGVWVLVGNTPFPLQGAEDLASKRIRGIIPYKSGVLVVTAYNGLFYCDGRTMEPFVTGAEDFMRENDKLSGTFRDECAFFSKFLSICNSVIALIWRAKSWISGKL